jgi:hypothetical protein
MPERRAAQAFGMTVNRLFEDEGTRPNGSKRPSPPDQEEVPNAFQASGQF